jgi:hypothetical protein
MQETLWNLHNPSSLLTADSIAAIQDVAIRLLFVAFFGLVSNRLPEKRIANGRAPLDLMTRLGSVRAVRFAQSKIRFQS